MAKTKKVTTKKPTGLTITRNGQWFTIKWKIGDKDYGDGQQMQYHLSSQKNGKWTSVSGIGKKTTSKSIKIENADYYPNKSTKLTKITFRIRGNRQEYSTGSGKKKKKYSCAWSYWASKEINLYEPPKPSISATLDEELTNVCKFSWSVDVSDDSKRPYTSVEWQTILSPQGSTETDGSKLKWSSDQSGWDTGTSTATSETITRTEDTVTLTNGSYTRWVRVRARGIAGASDWVYSKHVYAMSFKPQVISVKAEENAVGGFSCMVEWEAGSSAANPIDKTTVQYAIVEPEGGLTCPSGASWTNANISKDTSDNDAARFSIDDTLSRDQCLFVRVNTQHDSYMTYGTPTLASVGYLKDPTGLSVETDNMTYRATINATNASNVEDSFLVVVYQTASDPEGAFPVGIIPHGSHSVTVQCPNWSQETAVSFGVYAAVGNYHRQDRADGVSMYNVNVRMKSLNTVWEGGSVPTAPANVAVAQTAIKGTVQITWDWTWGDANSAEISWSDHEDAWESTDKPETFKISQLHAARWNISGLETGITWYIRVRLVNETADVTTNGPWSDMVSIDLSSAPTTPTLYLSRGVIPQDGSVTASWAYSTTDGTAQAYAEICEATVDSSGISYGEVIAHTTTAQQTVINAEDVGWQSGETHHLCIRVTSASGHVSDTWSDPVAVVIADPLEAHITDTTLQNVVVVDDADEGTQHTAQVLTLMPLRVTISGAGSGGVTTLAIERADDYHMDRPDGRHVDGYQGETVFLFSQTGEDEITVNVESLIGALDDGAPYRLVATVQDGLGQFASDTLDFEVHWSHQAVMPEATVEVDEENHVAKITPIAPGGVEVGDTCDIYRLSADRPELIVQDGTFGHTYVDPYPAIGEFGGHRVVFKTANGDYITEDNQPAWVDLGEDEGDILDIEYNIIDFDGNQVLLYYNVDLSSKWDKDFNETQYLGGSVQGDWNPAISRTGSISATTITLTDQETIRKMRELATYAGVCHVRTRDGSSYEADVQVSDDRDHEDYDKIATFALTITRVDPEGFEGIPIEMWQAEQEEE